MNYILCKTIIQSIFIVIMILIFKKVKKTNIKKSKKIFIIGVIFILILNFFPIYFHLIKFNSLESAFKFYQPNSKVVKKYKYDNYAYVLYQEDDYSNISCFVKKNNTWNLDAIYNKGMFPLDIKEIGKYHIYIKESPDKKTKAIMIVQYFNKNEKIEKKVSDSMNSKITTTLSDRNTLGTVTVTHTVVIDSDVSFDYRIYVNDDELKIFE